MKKGLFISFEGADGSGKSTIAKLFFSYLKENNVDAILTREPGGTNSKVSEAIRTLVLDHKDYNILPMTEALLFAASRSQHIHEIIIPALNENKTIISDRFIDSSLAYQGCGKQLGIKRVYDINIDAINNVLPDITFFVDVKAEIGMQRIKDSNRETNRLDDESIEMHKRVYDGYHELIKLFPMRIVSIDGNKSINEVLEEVITKYNNFVKG